MEIVTRSFANQCLAFRDRVDQALAEIEDIHDAKDILDKAAVMQKYAERLRAGVEVQRPIAISVLKIKAKLGELMPAEQGKRTDKLPKADLGGCQFSAPTIAAYRKLAAHADRMDEYYATVSETEDDVPSQSDFLKFVSGGPHVSNNSGCNEWYTPEKYIKAARRVLGKIDLDPASSEVAQRIVKATNFYTIEDDGLSQSWSGRVFLNPPYAKDLVDRFSRKLADSFDRGDVQAAILLVNNATETGWFQFCLEAASAVCFPEGRIKYLDETGTEQNSPLQGQAFMYFGPRVATFAGEFSAFGVAVEIK